MRCRNDTTAAKLRICDVSTQMPMNTSSVTIPNHNVFKCFNSAYDTVDQHCCINIISQMELSSDPEAVVPHEASDGRQGVPATRHRCIDDD